MSKKKCTGERLDTRALGPVMLEHLHRYAIVLEAVRNKAVLDIACGEGYGSALLASFASSVLGADLDAEAISEAKKKYKQHNLNFVEAAINALPFADASFDVIVCFETLEHVKNHDDVLNEFKRVLRPDGFLIISTPNKREYSDKREFANPFHVKELTTEDFKQLMQNHFNYNRYWLQECLLASIICHEEGNGLQESFTGDFTSIARTATVKPMYVIALASRQPLSLGLPSGLFRNDLLSQRYFDEERNSAKTTASYKLGHALLWPAKKILSIFQNQKIRG